MKILTSTANKNAASDAVERRPVKRGAGFILAALLLAAILTGCAENTAETPEQPIILSTPAPTPAPTPEPVPTPTPEPTPTPDPFEEFFLPEGEERFEVNEDMTDWEYASHVLSITIKEVRDDSAKHTYYVADIHQRQGERERAGFSRGEYRGKREFPYKIARRYGAVFALNGDFIDTLEKGAKGILIRDGVIYSENDAADSLVFRPDGALELLEKEDMSEGTAQRLLDEGVQNVYSFGPALVTGGEVGDEVASHRLKNSNPRCGIGMVEPNHYIAIVCDGRKTGVYGMKLVDFANLFIEYGCTLAYNLDGGASANMVLMGLSVLQSKTAESGRRPTVDVLMLGSSALVPELDAKIAKGALSLAANNE